MSSVIVLVQCISEKNCCCWHWLMSRQPELQSSSPVNCESSVDGIFLWLLLSLVSLAIIYWLMRLKSVHFDPYIVSVHVTSVTVLLAQFFGKFSNSIVHLFCWFLFCRPQVAVGIVFQWCLFLVSKPTV